MKPYKLFAACLPGLEALLDLELAELGIGVRKISKAGVEFLGHASSVAKVCLGSGLSTRVLLRFERFRATRFDTLVRRVAEVPWEDYLLEDESFDVRADISHCRLWHGAAVEERIAKGIMQRLGNRAILAQQLDGQLDGDDAQLTDENLPVVRVRAAGDRFGLALDLSGAPLWRRSWRLEGAKAPLREDLARALVLVSGWDRQSPFGDPFCGSGTIGIEAASLARGLAPGRLRSFAFERSKLAVHAKLAEQRQRALDSASSDCPPILLSDRDQGAVQASRNNAERAGVLPSLSIHCAALSDAPILSENFERSPGQGLTIVSNPPYGSRIGSKDLRALYQRLGHLVSQVGNRPAEQPGSVLDEQSLGKTCLTLMTADARLARATGIELETMLSSDHGGMPVRAMRGFA